MKINTATIGVAVGLCCMLAGCAALGTSKVGKNEYESYCASCHGVSGKGDGPQASSLAIKPADLTMLAKKNGGVFPAERVSEIIDGRVDVAAHGPRTMPVWGMAFQIEPLSQPQELANEPIGARESIAHAKVKALVGYLSRLQDVK